MLLRKITNDISVRYIPKSGQTKEGDIKPDRIKAASFSRKQNKDISKNNKHFFKNI